jgi:hypothetical protein
MLQPISKRIKFVEECGSIKKLVDKMDEKLKQGGVIARQEQDQSP